MTDMPPGLVGEIYHDMEDAACDEDAKNRLAVGLAKAYIAGRCAGAVPVSLEVKLPPLGKYVLIYVDLFWRVAKRQMGNHLGPNNQRTTYYWSPLGPGRFFGQEPTLWCSLPEVPS